jgi:hypothetical protein
MRGRNMEAANVSCPSDYPWLRDGRCWPSHYFDNLAIYGPSVEPLPITLAEENDDDR